MHLNEAQMLCRALIDDQVELGKAGEAYIDTRELDAIRALLDASPVEIPFGLTSEDLKLDPASLNDSRTVVQTLRMISQHTDEDGFYDSWEDDSVERVLRSAVLLHQAGAGTLAQCLDTAVIWERG